MNTNRVYHKGYKDGISTDEYGKPLKTKQQLSQIKKPREISKAEKKRTTKSARDFLGDIETKYNPSYKFNEQRIIADNLNNTVSQVSPVPNFEFNMSDYAEPIEDPSPSPSPSPSPAPSPSPSPTPSPSPSPTPSPTPSSSDLFVTDVAGSKYPEDEYDDISIEREGQEVALKLHEPTNEVYEPHNLHNAVGSIMDDELAFY
tara:strand:+ start:2434 stop:3039 length:606 start_codon:yes stop_codon:yes gene_type:complete